MSVVLDNLDVYWAGFRTTVSLTTLSYLLALTIGILLASFRVSPIGPLRVFATFYVNTVRNTPVTVILVLLFFGLPKLGFLLGAFTTAVVALGCYTGAFVGETVRSGINTVGKGQVKAARAVGLGFTSVLRLVVLPQALRATVAPLGSLLSALVRNSAVAYTISVLDIMGQSDRLITETAQPIPVLIGAAIAYYIITVPLAVGINWLEGRQRITR